MTFEQYIRLFKQGKYLPLAIIFFINRQFFTVPTDFTKLFFHKNRKMNSFKNLNSRMFLKRVTRINANTLQPLAICPFSDRIFIPNNSISVLSPSGEYLYSIKDPSVLYSIQGICFFDEIICVTNSHNDLIVFMTTDGDVVARAGGDVAVSPGVMMDNPTGLVAYLDYDLFICDNNNNRIINLFPDLPLSRIIGRGILSRPVDVKVHNENIFVLDSSSPCIASFDLYGEFISRIFSREHFQYASIISGHLCFTIDRNGNFIFSDTRYSVLIFSTTGQLLEKAGKRKKERTVGPIGVAINSLFQIVCVCRGNQNHIQIF